MRLSIFLFSIVFYLVSFSFLSKAQRIQQIDLFDKDYPRLNFNFLYKVPFIVDPEIIQVSLTEDDINLNILRIDRNPVFDTLNIHFIYSSKNLIQKDFFKTDSELFINNDSIPENIFIASIEDKVVTKGELSDFQRAGKRYSKYILTSEQVEKYIQDCREEIINPEVANIFLCFFDSLNNISLSLIEGFKYNEIDLLVSVFPLADNTEPEENKDSFILYWDRFLNPDYFFTKLQKLIFNWNFRLFDLDVETSSPLSLKSTRKYKIEIFGTGKLTDEIIHYTFPDKILNEFFLNETLAEANKYIYELNYTKGIRLLKERYEILPLNEFNHKAAETILKAGRSKLKNDPYSFLEYFDEIEKIGKKITFDWFNLQKEELFYECFLKLDSNKSDLNLKLNVAERLLSLNKNNSEYKLFVWQTNAEISLSLKNYWQAVHYLLMHYNLSKNQNIGFLLENSIDNALINSFKKNEYEKIVKEGEKYKALIEKKQSRRFYFGEACFQNKHYYLATDQFEYLVFNWNDELVNLGITWNNAMYKLQFLYSNTFQLDKSFALSRRLYRSEAYEFGTKKELLFSSLMNLRLKHLAPFAEVLSVENLINQDFINEIGKISMPAEITAIGKISRSFKNHYFFSLKDFSIQPEILLAVKDDKPLIMFEKPDMDVWMIKKVSDGWVVIQLNNAVLDPTEQELFRQITLMPESNNIWEDLYNYEENKGIRLVSRLLSASIGNGILKTKISADLFWNLLQKTDFIYYFAIHSKEKQTTWNGKTINPSFFPEGEYEKSSRTGAFYEIGLNYNNLNLIDISNPVYINSNWEGVVRLGFIKK